MSRDTDITAGAPRPKPAKSSPDRREQRRVADILAQHEAMAAERQRIEYSLRLLHLYVLPSRAGWWGWTPEQVTERLLDQTAVRANELLAGALHSLLTPEGSQYFRFDFQERDEDDQIEPECAVWGDETTRALHAEMEAHGSQNSLSEAYLDTSGAGCGVHFVGEDRGRPVFTARHTGEIFLGADGYGRVVRLHRKFELTAEQAMRMFNEPEDRLPKEIVQVAQGADAQKTTYRFLHVVDWREQPPSGAGDLHPTARAVSDDYVCLDLGRMVREGGYHEWPYQTPRWSRLAGSVYGSGCGHTALSDILMLHAQWTEVIRGAQYANQPTLMVPNDSFLGSDALVIAPGHQQPYDRSVLSKEDVFALPGGGDQRIGVELVRLVRDNIESAFYREVLQLPLSPNMTAAEVHERRGQKMLLMRPMLGRLQNELILPMIARAWGVLYRNGRLPQMPDAVKRRRGQLVIRLQSPFTRTQQQEEAGVLHRYMASVAPIADKRPEVWHTLDFPGIVRENAFKVGVPARFVRSLQHVQRAVAGEREEQQAGAMAAAAPGVARAVKDAVDAASAASALNAQPGLPPLADEG